MTYGDYPDFAKVNKILVVKMRHLGDVLLSTPLFSVLKKRYPHVSIDALVYAEGKSILEGHFGIDNVFIYDRGIKKLPFFKKILSEYKLLQNLKKNKYDLIINLTEGDRGALITKFTKPLYSVGMTDKKGFLGKKIYSHLLKNCSTPRHQVERDLDALRIIGVFPSWDERDLVFSIDEKSKMSVKEYDDFYLYCPFSRWKFKCLSQSQMRKILSYLVDKKKKVIICGGKDLIEAKMARDLIEGFCQKSVINLVGKINLKELGALMQKSLGVICVDSLALHLSSALKKRAIVFFGPTSEVKWGPWKNKEAHVITKSLSCRPCGMDGCGGSKYSDCLARLDLNKAFLVIDSWITE